MKALRNAERRAYPDFDAVMDLDEQGYLAISGSSDDLTIAITDTGKQALKEWADENEVRI
jgi:DNA-binding PadR family transcriptional regulator